MTDSSGIRGALRLDRICRRFGNLRANDDISLTIRQGEIHAVLGENGAGKSTLMRIVAGVISPDSGDIYVDGVKVDIHSPHDAARHGIQMVHQHFALIEPLTVAENLHLARVKRMRERVVLTDVREELFRLRDEYGLHLDPEARVHELSIGSRQRLEISRALLLRARILILDEPTAVLTPNEVDDFFRLLRTLQRRGVSIIFISHKLAEVLAISDRITVLRQGRVADSLPTSTATVERLSLAVVGQPIRIGKRQGSAPPRVAAPPALELRDISTKPARDRVQLRNINLMVRPGEVLGIAGIDGNGQSELVDVVVGAVKPQMGAVRILGAAARVGGRAPKLAHIPDDRGRKGLVLSMTCKDNLLLRLRDDPRFFRFGLIRRQSARDYATALLKQFMVRTSALDMPAGTLSGGNQQRLLLARELAGAPQMIVAAQPTRGLDVAGAAFVHETLRDHRDRGAGILIVSTELEELLALADRIIVMFRGEFMGEVPADDADLLQLGFMMMGGERRSEPTATVTQ